LEGGKAKQDIAWGATTGTLAMASFSRCCDRQALQLLFMTQVMVLSAGLGTRLRPLTLERPKALVPIGDRPALDHALGLLQAAGHTSAVVNTHHHAELFAPFERERISRLQVVFSHESELLGTAGAIHSARSQLTWPLLTWNADVITRPPLAELFATPPQFARLLVAEARGRGSLGLSAEGRVVRLRGEQWAPEQRQADFVGIAIWAQKVASVLPERGCLIGDVCLPWLRAGGSIETVPSSQPWFDIGSLSGYVAANAHWLSTRAQSEGGNYRAASSQVSSEVDLGRCIVGDGVQLTGSGLAERCIFWPRAVARAPVQDCVVTSSGQVVPYPSEMGHGDWA
jgi:mannose-1-phosphate guanylyltransferase